MLTRRGAVLGLGTLAVSGAATSVAQAVRSAPRAERSSADERLAQFIRLRTSPDGSPVIWSYSGVLIGKPDGQLARPLVRIDGMSFTYARPQASGAYEWQLDEVGYYCDLESGAVLEHWTNPFTGAEVRPAHYRSPQTMQFTPQGVRPGRPLPPGVEFRGEITTLAEVAGIIAMTEDLYVRVPGIPSDGAKPARPERISSSLATFTARAADLHLPASRWVDCQLSYTTMNSFAAWLAMDGTSGLQNMRLVGRKCRRTDRSAVPAWLRERIALDHPTFLTVSEAWHA